MNAVFYDIETIPVLTVSLKYGDAQKQQELTVAVTCTYEGQIKVWFEDKVAELISYLLSFEKIIGFNIKHFDNAVLDQYQRGSKNSLDEKSVDLIEAIEFKLGFRLSLQDLVEATLNTSKSGTGEEAISWWMKGEKDRVISYCKDDVVLTKKLFEFGLQNGKVLFRSGGEINIIKIDWLNPRSHDFDETDFLYRSVKEDDVLIKIDQPGVNSDFDHALELAQNTDQILYISGKAGTGKSVFSKFLKQSLRKKIALVAFTGVAAIRIGGQTIHSFFKIDFNDVFLPNDKKLRTKVPQNDPDKTTIFSHFKYTAARIDIMRNLDCLIIDEVSMARAELIDLIDKLLRAFRGVGKSHLPFGGVQVIFVGDMFQLPPIQDEGIWSILRRFYDTPFFFSAHIFRNNPPINIEFKKPYRQSEQDFIALLDRVRVAQPNQSDLQRLSNQSVNGGWVQPQITQQHFDEGYIALCSTNMQVREINGSKLEHLPGALFSFQGVLNGKFELKDAEKIVEVVLQLKVGAQIMFLKNSSRYFNGKIGRVEKLEEKQIWVSTIDGRERSESFVVEKATWEKFTYRYNKEEDEIEQEKIGDYTQYPIKLAWAITVHKSQGQSFDKVIVNLNNFTPPGLAYVALSRCRKMNGLILKSPILPQMIQTDQRIVDFAAQITPETLIVDKINQGKADILYKQARLFFKEGKFESALLSFLKALEYRNDLETDLFRRYISIYLRRITSFRSHFEKSIVDKVSLTKQVDELNQIISKIQIQVQESLVESSKLKKSLSKSKSTVTELKKNVEQLGVEIDTNHRIETQLRAEIERLKQLNWFDKLLGKK